MKSKSLLLLFLLCLSHSAQAQVYAHLKLRDAKLRYPKLNEIEFPGTTPTRATYDALYGHGAVCENEYVAFRVYMDHRQSLDLYGKRRPQLELDSTNFYTDANWRAKGYGEDILYAGTSVAARPPYLYRTRRGAWTAHPQGRTRYRTGRGMGQGLADKRQDAPDAAGIYHDTRKEGDAGRYLPGGG